jgi:hypothetical protein
MATFIDFENITPGSTGSWVGQELGTSVWKDPDTNADVEGVFLYFDNTGNGSDETIGARHPDATTYVTGGIEAGGHTTLPCAYKNTGTSPIDRLDVYVSDNTNLSVYLVGYLHEDEGEFLTDPVEKDQDYIQTWETRSVDSQIPADQTATVACFQHYTSNYEEHGYRQTGSSLNTTSNSYYNDKLTGQFVGLDSNNEYEHKGRASAQQPLFVGWLTDETTANAENEYTMSGTGSWESKDITSETSFTADSAFVLFRYSSTNNADVGIRSPDQTTGAETGIGYDNFATFTGLSSAEVFEAYTDDTDNDPILIGYSTRYTSLLEATADVTASTSDVPNPSLSVGTATANADVTAATSDVVNPSVDLGTATVSGDVTQAVGQANNAFITGSGTASVSADVTQATSEVVDLSLALSSVPVSVDATQASSAVNNPSIIEDFRAFPNAVQGSSDVPNPAVEQSAVTLAPDAVQATSSVPNPAGVTSGSGFLPADVTQATSEVVDPSVSFPTAAPINATVGEASAEAVNPSLTTGGEATLSASVTAASSSVPSPEVQSDALITADVTESGSGVPNPTIAVTQASTIDASVTQSVSVVPNPDPGGGGGIEEYDINVVTDYGANNTVGDDTDTTNEVQAAIDAASPGQVVFFPNGEYFIDGFYLNTADVTVRGESRDNCILRSTGASNTFINMDTYLDGCVIERFKIDVTEPSGGDVNAFNNHFARMYVRGSTTYQDIWVYGMMFEQGLPGPIDMWAFREISSGQTATMRRVYVPHGCALTSDNGSCADLKSSSKIVGCFSNWNVSGTIRMEGCHFQRGGENTVYVEGPNRIEFIDNYVTEANVGTRMTGGPSASEPTILEGNVYDQTKAVAYQDNANDQFDCASSARGIWNDSDGYGYWEVRDNDWDMRGPVGYPCIEIDVSSTWTIENNRFATSSYATITTPSADVTFNNNDCVSAGAPVSVGSGSASNNCMAGGSGDLNGFNSVSGTTTSGCTEPSLTPPVDLSAPYSAPGGGGTSPGASAGGDRPPTVTDDFEDGGLSEYVGDTAQFSTVTPGLEGSNYALRQPTGTGYGNYIFANADVLPVVPEQGDQFEYLHQPGTTGGGGIQFGVEEATADAPDRYGVYFDPDPSGSGSDLQILKFENGTANIIARQTRSISFTRSDTYTVRVWWNNPEEVGVNDEPATNDIYVEVRNPSNQAIAFTRATDETEYGQADFNGIGWGDGPTQQYDLLTVRPDPPELPTIDDFEDGDLSEYRLATATDTSFSVDSADSFNGGFSLSVDSTDDGIVSLPGGNENHPDGDGINYIEPGDHFEFYVKYSATGFGAGVYYFADIDSTVGGPGLSGYQVYFENDKVDFIRDFTVVDTLTFSALPTGEWHKVEVFARLNDTDTHRVIVHENDGTGNFTEVASQDFTDATYTAAGGVGYTGVAGARIDTVRFVEPSTLDATVTESVSSVQDPSLTASGDAPFTVFETRAISEVVDPTVDTSGNVDIDADVTQASSAVPSPSLSETTNLLTIEADSPVEATSDALTPDNLFVTGEAPISADVTQASSAVPSPSLSVGGVETGTGPATSGTSEVVDPTVTVSGSADIDTTVAQASSVVNNPSIEGDELILNKDELEAIDDAIAELQAVWDAAKDLDGETNQ